MAQRNALLTLTVVTRDDMQCFALMIIEHASLTLAYMRVVRSFRVQ